MSNKTFGLLHNGLGFQPRPRKVKRGPIRFNSGPTPRDAIWDFVDLIQEYPEVWDKL